jgi:molybdate transport system ATP-binding protein
VDDRGGGAPAGAANGDVIELSVELPLSGFSLSVRERLGNGITAVMGPSGSGKTSLLEALAGLRPRTRGRVVLDGSVLLDTAAGVSLPPERRRVGYVPQDAGLFPHLTTLGNVRFGARGAEERIRMAIETLGLRPLLDRYPATLSGGEKQRVAMARALAIAPRLLLLDEPLAALDVGLRDRIVPYLVRMQEEWKIPVLYVTHNVGEALSVAEAVVLLRAGKVEAHGPALGLLSLPTLSADAEAGIENLLQGRIVAHDARAGTTRVVLDDGTALTIPLAAARVAGDRASLAIRAEDIVLATEPLHGLSARNVVQARITSVDRVGHDVLVRCAATSTSGSGRAWLVRITPAALEALALAVESGVWLAIKSHSIRLL